ncbi:serine hydroxymethyltransferase [Candidatus Woesearchaeota archaeon]|nr:serine hydroxymethyltransferase [Candidatus Woesearchaeota archaeon]
MEMMDRKLKEADPEIAKAVEGELNWERETIHLIPSDNLASRAVLEALGSVFDNRYSEGYAGKRYYGSQEFVDRAETLAIERAKKIFGAEHVNIQCYSGSPANLAIYFALLNPGDKVLAMDLTHGGHLTHGSPVNFTGRSYNFVHYGVDRETERIDYAAVREMAIKEKPKLIVSGATAYSRQIDFKKFAAIAKEVGAMSMADISHITGLIIGGVHPSPFPETDVVMTTTHKTLRGPRGAMIMCKKEFAEKIDKAVFPGMQGGPHDHATAAKAVALKEAMQPEFKDYAAQIVKNARALAKGLIENGIKLVSGGTDNHLILINLTPIEKGHGIFAQKALEKANITVNKNTIPYEPSTPFYPSGIRIGTPTITTRGMKEPEMAAIADMMATVIKETEKYSLPAEKAERKPYLEKFSSEISQNSKIRKVRDDVIKLSRRFPVYEGLTYV